MYHVVSCNVWARASEVVERACVFFAPKLRSRAGIFDKTDATTSLLARCSAARRLRRASVVLLHHGVSEALRRSCIVLAAVLFAESTMKTSGFILATVIASASAFTPALQNGRPTLVRTPALEMAKNAENVEKGSKRKAALKVSKLPVFRKGV